MSDKAQKNTLIKATKKGDLKK